MSKVLKTVAIIAAVVAITFTLGPQFGITFGVTAATAATIAAVAGAVSTAASLAAGALQKPPDMKGTINEVMIGANMPVPYVMGRTFVGGFKVYDDSQNDPAGGVNKDRNQIFVGSHAGPIDSFEKFMADYSPITFATETGGLISGVASGYYGADGGYLWLNTRKGARPETALTAVGGRTTPRGWTSDHKLSGMAAWLATMEFDEDGERWAGGIPAFGMVAKWVLAYDPRLDSSYPGGSGSHDWTDESTWTWTENPGLNALTYARGRFMGTNDSKVVGCGIAQDAIDIPAFVELANVCDANDWTCGGAVYEGPGLSKWDNLKRILAAGAAEPAWIGGMLTVRISAPKTSLYTLTADDLADSEIEVQAMSHWKDRQNTIVPRYRSEDHRWEYVQADAVVNSTYLTEDGETKSDEVQFDLCQDLDQAAQLAAYTIVNRREFGPIRLHCKPHLMAFQPGEALELDIPEAGLESQLAVITSRSVDPGTGSVQLTLESETTAKHTWALALTGTAPPTPTIVPPEDIDTTVSAGSLTVAQITTLIVNSWPSGLTFSVATTGAVTVSNHDRVYADKTAAVTGDTTAAPGGAVAGDAVAVFYDDPTRAGGAVTYQTLLLVGGAGSLTGANASSANPYRHFVSVGTVPATGTTSGGSGAGSGGGSGSGSGYGGGGGSVFP